MTADYLDTLDYEKQERFNVKIAGEVLRGVGLSAKQIAVLEKQAAREGAGGLTPEWACDQLHLPVLILAVRDYWLEKGPQTFFPDPAYLLLNSGRPLRRAAKGKNWGQVWDELWHKTHEDFGGARPLAVCFRVKWSSSVMCLHNYRPALDAEGLDGWLLYRRWPSGLTVLQQLRDFLTVLRKNWIPAFAAEAGGGPFEPDRKLNDSD